MKRNNNLEEEINAVDVELSERYVTALERIKELTNEIQFTDQDIADAEKYLDLLNAIEKTDANFNEDDIADVEKHLQTLVAISENE